MKAIRMHEPAGFEGIDGLVYEDAPDPPPAIGDALVQMRAASFTPTELTWPLRTDRAGHDRGAIIPAHGGSGVVVALGYGTAGVALGDEVDDGVVRPQVSAVYLLADAREAFMAKSTQYIPGKVVLTA
jgi:NADPH:quinone reductase-like Zn-dependent oxidoreductase